MRCTNKKIIILITFFAVALSCFSQNTFTLTGKVTDATTNEELIGVTVKIKNSSKGTVTSYDGTYNLEVTPTDVIIFSYIGYKTREISVNEKKILTIQLISDFTELTEVVVVGFGVQKKESVVGAISSIDNKTLTSVPATNLSQSLAGKVTGVQIVQPSGEVGKDEAQIFVRGRATYGDATPLFVIDGIVRESFVQIDPNEVESINVLKDASATAVYGIRGANGVIIVTTKRGVEGKPKVSVTAQHAFTQPTRIPQPLLSYQASLLANTNKLSEGRTEYTKEDILNYRTGASPHTHPDVDWVGEIMKKFSTQQQYNVNISGGSKNVKYFVSGGYLTQNGFYKYDPYTNFSRYNFRSNLDLNITKNLSVAINLGSRIEQRQYPSTSEWSSWGIYRASFATSGRVYPVYNPDGSLSGGDKNEKTNIIGAIRDRGVYREVKSVLELGTNINYNLNWLVKGLSLRAQFAFDNNGMNGRRWTKGYSVYSYDLANDKYTQQNEDTKLGYGDGRSENANKFYYEGGIYYDRKFGDHAVTGLLLGNRSETIKNTETEYANQGVVGRVTYNYALRYLAEFNMAYNGSENFPAQDGKRYGFFPSFSLGWVLSNEAFIQNSAISNALSHLKIRGSLGWVGNDKLSDPNNNPERFMFLQSYVNAGGYSFGTSNNWYDGIRQDKIANFDVTWEVGRKANVGIESNFFNNLFGINVDLFHERRTNILTDIGNVMPSYVGIEFKAANLGIVENKGFEIDLKHNKTIGKNFNYYVRGNFSYTKNKVIRRADPQGLLAYQKEEGYSIGTPLVYNQIGIFQDYDDINNSPNQTTRPGVTEVRPGDLKYEDFNGDGIITLDDRLRMGYGDVPEIQYGVTFGADYKGVDFSILFQGSARSNFNKNWEIMWHFSNNDNVFEKHWYHWTPEMSGNERYVRLYGPNYQNNESGSTYSLGSGNYIRLKTIEVGYTLPESFTKKLHISNLRLYLSGNNLVMWANEMYIDPDNRDQRGGSMPPTAAYNAGITLNF